MALLNQEGSTIEPKRDRARGGSKTAPLQGLPGKHTWRTKRYSLRGSLEIEPIPGTESGQVQLSTDNNQRTSD